MRGHVSVDYYCASRRKLLGQNQAQGKAKHYEHDDDKEDQLGKLTHCTRTWQTPLLLLLLLSGYRTHVAPAGLHLWHIFLCPPLQEVG